mmetsp:Transcript_13927/g.35185  ORF Transcript_13927/g.35185 Transcript_13927/m.35185 type:complete len:596 (-) Transcript_13927:1564-3351(-)
MYAANHAPPPTATGTRTSADNMSIEDVVKRGSRACEYALIAMESEGHGLRASETLGVALAVREKVGCSGDRRARSARAPVTLYALKGRTYAGRKTLRPVLWRASQPAWASSVANTVSRDQPRAWIPAYNAETFILAGLFGSTKPSVTRKEPEQWHGFQASPSCDEPTDAEVAKLLHELAFPRVESVLANCTESTGGPVQCEQPLATVHAPLFVYPPKYGSTAAALYPYARLHDAIKGLLEAARRRAEPGLTREDVILQLDEDENIKIDEVAFNSFIEHDNMRYSLRSNGKPAGTFWRTPSAGGPGATRADNEPVRYILRADLRCVECNRTAPSPTTTCICYACGSGTHRNCLSSQQRNDFDRLGEAWQCSVCEVGKAPAPLPSTLSSAGASEEIDVGQRPRAADQSVNRRPKRLIYQERSEHSHVSGTSSEDGSMEGTEQATSANEPQVRKAPRIFSPPDSHAQVPSTLPSAIRIGPHTADSEMGDATQSQPPQASGAISGGVLPGAAREDGPQQGRQRNQGRGHRLEDPIESAPECQGRCTLQSLHEAATADPSIAQPIHRPTNLPSDQQDHCALLSEKASTSGWTRGNVAQHL